METKEISISIQLSSIPPYQTHSWVVVLHPRAEAKGPLGSVPKWY